MSLVCSVIGAGSFGTSLAVQLARQGHEVALWDRNPDRCAAMNTQHHNPRYLPHVPLPEELVATSDLAEAVSRAELIVAAVPSHAMREVMAAAGPGMQEGTWVCCATKGIEEGTLQTMHDVLVDVLPDHAEPHIAVFSGPTFAEELARGLPSTAVVAGSEAAAAWIARAFHGGPLRVYHSHDVVGVCVGGSIKNVMAIACGISDGLGLGLNARAGLITRGLAEITRLAVKLGADPMTMMGLAGLGDLVLTCTGDLSRNRRVGLELGRGQRLDAILAGLGQVAEGVVTARSAWELGRKVGVEMPITEQVYEILYQDKPAPEALEDLLGRRRRAEIG
ncbi:MAG TPA: NAD(P)H-dependent glycerol-3-phosphate dehydrogenase [Myxococcota bacterium]|nr:NAD(P)H-dependent glycerol-3-phosphate dehydrogenase [Myxococcota bacterium]